MPTIEALPALPFERPSPLEIAPLYRQLQDKRPVARVRTLAGDEAWLVTRHADVQALLGDERLARSHPDPARAARISGSALLGGPTGSYATQREDHARMRRVFTPSFAPRRMQALQPRIQVLVENLLDQLGQLEPPADFHAAVAFLLPVLVICELLGVPFADREQFRGWSDDVGHLRDRARAEAALQQLRTYMADLIRHKRATPGQDVISDLVAARDERGQLSESEIVRYAAGLLFAGHETTVTRIDFGTLLLLSHPEQRERLVRDPALVQPATEEILRLAAPSQTELPRYAQDDIQLEGVTIHAGDAVLLAIAAANRDPRAFRDPDRFDIAREPNPHVAFGYGGHYCLGASLARLELRAVVGSLFRRLPGLRLAVPIEQLRLRQHLLTGGLEALPVAW